MKTKELPDIKYKCDKCSCEIMGGFNPTGFCFDQIEGRNDLHLCRPCYVLFWRLHKEFCFSFIQPERLSEKTYYRNEDGTYPHLEPVIGSDSLNTTNK